jgi:vacuolar protein sorting-associated protein 16
LLEVKIFQNSILLFTREFKSYYLKDVLASPPKFVKLVDPDFEEIPNCLEIFPKSKTDIELLIAPANNSILGISENEFIDFELVNGPFTKISGNFLNLTKVSPKKDYIATFNSKGIVWVFNSEFTQNCFEFNTKAPCPPFTLTWCGNDTIVCYWRPEQLNSDTSLLLLIGNQGDYQKFLYEGHCSLVCEVDGLRVISKTSSDLIEKIPPSVLATFQIGSVDPPALLLDAYKEFVSENDLSIKSIRILKNKIKQSIRDLLDAAKHQIKIEEQKLILKAASYGKIFLPNESISDFNKIYIETCQILRILNSLRSKDYGILLTYNQFVKLTPTILINRLISFGYFKIALHLSDILNIDSTLINQHWAESIVENNESDKEIVSILKKRFTNQKNFSFAKTALASYAFGKKKLAVKILELENTSIYDICQFLLLLGEPKKSLEKAISINDTNLVFVLLNHIKKNYSKKLVEILSDEKFSIARTLLISHSSKFDQDFCLELLKNLKILKLYAFIYIIDSEKLRSKKYFQQRSNLLLTAKSLYELDKNLVFYKELSDEYLKLLNYQIHLTQKYEGKHEFFNLSLYNTIQNLLYFNDEGACDEIRKIFKIRETMFYWIKLRTLSDMGEWDELEQWYFYKTSPIGVYVKFLL